MFAAGLVDKGAVKKYLRKAEDISFTGVSGWRLVVGGFGSAMSARRWSAMKTSPWSRRVCFALLVLGLLLGGAGLQAVWGDAPGPPMAVPSPGPITYPQDKPKDPFAPAVGTPGYGDPYAGSVVIPSPTQESVVKRVIVQQAQPTGNSRDAQSVRPGSEPGKASPSRLTTSAVGKSPASEPGNAPRLLADLPATPNSNRSFWPQVRISQSLFRRYMALNLLVEVLAGLLALILLKCYRHRILFSIVVANVISYPPFYMFAAYLQSLTTYGGATYWGLIALLEVVVMAVEALVIYLLNRTEIQLSRAFQLSLFCNAVSVMVGVLLGAS